MSGVRWALTTSASHATPKSSSVRAACSIVGQSDVLPMMIPTRGVAMRERLRTRGLKTQDLNFPRCDMPQNSSLES